MAGELLDNQGRGDVAWSFPSIHPEGRKYGLIAVGISLLFLLLLDWEIVGWPLLVLSAGIFAFFRDPERVVPHEDSLMRQLVDRLGLSPMDSALARQKVQGGGSIQA